MQVMLFVLKNVISDAELLVKQLCLIFVMIVPMQPDKDRPVIANLDYSKMVKIVNNVGLNVLLVLQPLPIVLYANTLLEI